MNLTTTEAAARLGITVWRVCQLCQAGTLVARKHGRDWIIDGAEVERHARERKPRGRPKKEADHG